MTDGERFLREALEVVSEPSEEDKGAREIHEGTIVGQRVVVADRQAAKAQQPRDGALDDPAPTVATQRAPILIAVRAVGLVGGDELNPSTLQPPPQLATVVAAIGDDARGVLPGTPRPHAADGYGGERRFREMALREVGGGQVHSERKTRAVDQYHELCPLTLACLADTSAPFFAGANVPSRKASLHCTRPFASSSLRNARHSESQTCCRSHSAKRRQQVAGLGKSAGRSRQRAPVRRIQRIPSKQARSGARGRPPFGLATPRGSSGATLAHCASDSIDARINSPTGEMMDHQYSDPVRF